MMPKWLPRAAGLVPFVDSLNQIQFARLRGMPRIEIPEGKRFPGRAQAAATC